MNSIHLTSLVRNTGRALAASIVLATTCVAEAKPFSKIVTFGDSLSDTGNAYLLTGGYYPASPPNSDGRVSNGAIWVEHLADSLGMQLKPENQYAVAGARTDHDNFNALLGLPLAATGLQSQVEEFLQDSGAAGADPAALYTVWIGANDLFTTLTFGGNMNFTIYSAIQNTAQSVAVLASHGARHIVVANLPDLGLTPFGRSLGPAGSGQLSYLTDMCNLGLSQALDSLAANGIATVRLDAAGLIREIAANPASFGLVNVTGQANTSVADPDDYLFWDGVHPTTAGHRIVADRAVANLVAFYSPRHGKGAGKGLVNPLNGLVHASGR